MSTSAALGSGIVLPVADKQLDIGEHLGGCFRAGLQRCAVRERQRSDHEGDLALVAVQRLFGRQRLDAVRSAIGTEIDPGCLCTGGGQDQRHYRCGHHVMNRNHQLPPTSYCRYDDNFVTSYRQCEKVLCNAKFRAALRRSTRDSRSRSSAGAGLGRSGGGGAPARTRVRARSIAAGPAPSGRAS